MEPQREKPLVRTTPAAVASLCGALVIFLVSVVFIHRWSL
jgi:hypothetical protein